MRLSTMMLITSLVVPGVIAGSAFAQPVISIEGSCPTRLTFRWEEALPDHTGALIYSHATGNFLLPGPPCDGTRLGLGSSGIRLVRTFRTGPEGSGQMVGRAAAFACGGYLQVIIVEGNRPCTTSNVVQIPE